MNGFGVTQSATLGHAHGVHVTDQVGHGGVRGGQLLHVPIGAVPPGNGKGVTLVRCAAQGFSGDGIERVLIELRALDHRTPLVEQSGQGTQQAGLSLASLTQQHDVMAGNQGPLELRDDRAVKAVQTGPRILPGRQCGQEVVANLFTQGFLDVTCGAQVTHGTDLRLNAHASHATPGGERRRPLERVMTPRDRRRTGGP